MGQYKRMYGPEWRKARIAFLQEHPFCALCGKPLRGSDAVVDHIVPHRGDTYLFWDQGNWQSLCKHCHDSHKQRVEHGGFTGGCDVNGMPTDKQHPWNRWLGA